MVGSLSAILDRVNRDSERQTGTGVKLVRIGHVACTVTTLQLNGLYVSMYPKVDCFSSRNNKHFAGNVVLLRC